MAVVTPFTTNLKVLAAKLETTIGTAETIADADFDVRCRDIELTLEIPLDEDSSKFATGSHAEDPAVAGATKATLNFRVKAAWGGAVTSTPNSWKFLQACGLKEKAYTTTGIALQDDQAYDNKTITLKVFDIQTGSTPAGVAYTIAGAMGNVTIGADGIGMPWTYNFSFQGKLTAVADIANGALLSLTSPDTTVPEKLLTNTLSIGSDAQRISSFQLDLGNEVNPVINQADATGYDYFGITARNPRFTCNPLLQTVATEDIFTMVKAGTSRSILLSSTNFTVDIPVTQLMAPALADREGYVGWEQVYRCLRNGTIESDIGDESTFEFLIGAKT